MSLLPPTTCEGAVFQYCNYGYDQSKYTSYDQCLRVKTREDCGGVKDVIFKYQSMDAHQLFFIGFIIIAVGIVFYFLYKVFKKHKISK